MFVDLLNVSGNLEICQYTNSKLANITQQNKYSKLKNACWIKYLFL